MMLTRYHNEFTRTIPAVVPKIARPYFENPLLLMQVRAQLEAGFGRVPGGAALLQRLLAGVKTALLHGLQEIFFWSAVIMTASILLHVILKREPLRVRGAADVREPAAAAPAH